jgi:tetratricopeptide (TPR) repeat protein
VALLAALPGGPSFAAVSRSQQLKAETFERMNKGIKAVRNGEAKAAIDLLSQVSNVALNSFRAFYYLGVAYKADRQYSKAIEPLNFALDLDPTHLQAHVELGDCYLKRGDMGEALAEYHRALSIQNGYAPAWDGLGRSAESSGDDEKAVEHFRKAIDLNPGFPDASMNLGDLYLRRGRLREAVDLFLRAIAIRPNFAAAYNRLGVGYARQQLGNEAIAALRKAAELEKGNPWHPYTIGVIEMDLGYLGRALRSFETAIRLDENYLEAYVSKAMILRRMGRFEAAEFLLEKGSEKRSEDRKLKQEIADLREEFRRQRLAMEDLNARVEAGVATVEEIRSLATLRAETGDFTGAAIALERTREADGLLSAEDQFLLGYYHLRAGSFVDAEEVFVALRGERSGSQTILLNLGLSLEGQGKTEAALQVYEDALGWRPNDPILLTALGNVMIMVGNHPAAIRAYEKALVSPEEFDGRARVETILKALRLLPARGPDEGGLDEKAAAGGGESR